MATVKDFSVEEKLIALLTLQKIDSKSDEIKTLKGELPMEVKDLEDEIAGLQTRITNIDAEVASIDEYIEKEGISAREHVDPRMLGAYERIRNSYPNGLAVVPVLRDSCGGCFNVIPPQRQSEIRQRKKIVVCEHCGRILVDSDLNESVRVK